MPRSFATAAAGESKAASGLTTVYLNRVMARPLSGSEGWLGLLHDVLKAAKPIPRLLIWYSTDFIKRTTATASLPEPLERALSRSIRSSTGSTTSKYSLPLIDRRVQVACLPILFSCSTPRTSEGPEQINWRAPLKSACGQARASVFASASMSSDARWPMAIAGPLVLPETGVGMIEQSTTRNPVIP